MNMIASMLEIAPKCRPALDADFLPASLWNQAYREAVQSYGHRDPLIFALERTNGSISVYRTEVFPHREPWTELNLRYAERLLKLLLWSRGGFRIMLAGDENLTRSLCRIYSPDGQRRFDFQVMGEGVHGKPLQVIPVGTEDILDTREQTIPVAKSFDGCRIGLDLGGTNRKSAAIFDGETISVEVVPWNPYVQNDPQWHRQEICDSLSRVAEKLPRVDSIGVSAAGVYEENRVCFSSLFRGVPTRDFHRCVSNLFLELAEEWGNIPLIVVNDGQLPALAGAMSINENAVLGIAMGTCLAAGYVTQSGDLNKWINDLSFSPLDYREDAPLDEWSGDRGCGVQYLSQQAVCRLSFASGLCPSGSHLESQLVPYIRELVEKGDERAGNIYRTIGTYFGYAIAHYADIYEIHNVFLTGGVTAGPGGGIIIDEAKRVLEIEFPHLAAAIRIHAPDENTRLHGHAVSAACLPILQKTNGEMP